MKSYAKIAALSGRGWFGTTHKEIFSGKCKARIGKDILSNKIIFADWREKFLWVPFKLCQHITLCSIKKNISSLHNACCLKSLKEADYT